MAAEAPLESRAIVLTEVEQMGGAERSVLALSRWLYARGVAHHVVTYEDRAGLDRQAGHPITVVQLLPKMRATKKIGAMRRYFAGRRGGPAPLASGYQAAMHLTLARVRGFHCLMHDTPSLFEDQKPQALNRRVYRKVADRVTAHGLRSGGTTIVTSEYLRAECRRVFGVEAVIARMGGLRAQAFRPRPVKDTLRLLSVSRVEANKRIDWMLRALAQMETLDVPLSASVPWRLDVIGLGAQLDRMRQMAQTLGLAHRVQFHGFVDDVALEDFYARAHLFLMPAVQGYGIPAVEALSRGLPVLLHRGSGVSDILLDTPWATVIEGGEEGMLEGLQQAVAGVLDGRQLDVPLPCLPTEEGWAEQVAARCGWWH